MGKSKIILILSGCILFTYLIVLFFSGSVTMADAHRGFEAMHQFNNEGAWNVLNYPSVESPVSSSYISWWAPGQWMIPSLLIALGIHSIQNIQFLLIGISVLLSIYGYYRLFNQLKFAKTVNALSILCIVSNYTFYWQTLMYHGGELFLTALLPYFVLILLQLSTFSIIKRVLVFGGIAILGLFLKNTFFILLICGGIFILFYRNGTTFKERLRYAWPIALTFSVIAIPFYMSHLSVNETPSSAIDLEGYFNIPNTFIGDIVYSFGSPIGIFTRYNFLSHQINGMLFNHLRFYNVLQLLPFAVMLLFYARSYRLRSEKYHALLIYFCLPFFTAFTIFYLQDKAVSYEMRHFAAVGFLFFPGIIQWAKESKYFKIVGMTILLLCLMDLGIYSQQVTNINEKHLFWNDLKVPIEDGKILSAIEQWDAKHHNGLILIEDYWQLSIGQWDNDKMVVAIDGDKARLVSGMELDNPVYLKDMNVLVRAYDHILLICRTESKVKPKLKNKNWEQMISTKRFQIISADL